MQYSRYHSKSELTAKELLDYLSKINKEIDLNSVKVTRYVIDTSNEVSCSEIELANYQLFIT